MTETCRGKHIESQLEAGGDEIGGTPRTQSYQADSGAVGKPGRRRQVGGRPRLPQSSVPSDFVTVASILSLIYALGTLELYIKKHKSLHFSVQ